MGEWRSQIPPAFTYNLTVTRITRRFRPLRALLSSYARQATKGAGRTKWMNSPNVYQKVEILETGTPDPKKITKVEVVKVESKK